MSGGVYGLGFKVGSLGLAVQCGMYDTCIWKSMEKRIM